RSSWRLYCASHPSRFYCAVFFFFQAEDGIRDRNVTGVQTCALPIFHIWEHVTHHISSWCLFYLFLERFTNHPRANTCSLFHRIRISSIIARFLPHFSYNSLISSSA